MPQPAQTSRLSCQEEAGFSQQKRLTIKVIAGLDVNRSEISTQVPTSYIKSHEQSNLSDPWFPRLLKG